MFTAKSLENMEIRGQGQGPCVRSLACRLLSAVRRGGIANAAGILDLHLQHGICLAAMEKRGTDKLGRIMLGLGADVFHVGHPIGGQQTPETPMTQATLVTEEIFGHSFLHFELGPWPSRSQ